MITTQGPTLPQELVELIIDEVGKEEHESQRLPTPQACALTSYLFLTCARKHIFRSVFLAEDAAIDDEQDAKERRKLAEPESLLLNDPFKDDARQIELSRHIKLLSVQLSVDRMGANGPDLSFPTMATDPRRPAPPPQSHRGP